MASPWSQLRLPGPGWNHPNVMAGRMLAQQLGQAGQRLVERIPNTPLPRVGENLIPRPPWVDPSAQPPPSPTLRGVLGSFIPQNEFDVALAMMPPGRLLKGNINRAMRLGAGEGAEAMARNWAQETLKRVRGATELFSEMSPSKLTEFTGTNFSSTSLWASAQKHLALGMGSNKGVRVKFDSTALLPHEIQVRRKPGAMSDADLEYLAEVNAQTMSEAIKQIAIKPGTKMRGHEKRLIDHLTRGWERTKEEDGWTVFTRPTE